MTEKTELEGTHQDQAQLLATHRTPQESQLFNPNNPLLRALQSSQINFIHKSWAVIDQQSLRRNHLSPGQAPALHF